MKIKHNFFLVFVLALTVSYYYAQTPILNSKPFISNKVVYLDFDGQVVSGTLWNSGNPVYAAASTISSANKIVVWKRVSEDYMPFDVNITTDSVRFNNAPPNQRMRVIFTPTSAWYGQAGGVAYLGSFSWGGTPGTPCWVFENQLNYSARSMAEAAAHEAGHTFTLRHQSTYDANCNKTAEYNPGTGTGVTSWAPIMGVGYTKNVTIWHNGKSATNCNTIQFDHSNSGIGITSPGFLSFIPDDVGDVFNTAKILNLNSLNLSDSGIISQPTDIDAFRFTICNNRYVSINVKPWALDTTNYSGADLDVKLKVYNAANNLLVGDSSLTKLTALVGINLTPGSYYFTIDGAGSNNYSDYGSLGRYYISIKATNPPALANTILTNGNICANQNTVLNYTSNGVPTAWNWTVTGANSTTFTSQNPSVNFNPAGIYTIHLLATTPGSLSCVNTVTLNIGNTPNLSVSGPASSVCPQTLVVLTANGAGSYTWLPGNMGGATQNVFPTSNTTYTVRGSNGTCTSSITTNVNLSPAFTLNVNTSSPLICKGESATLTASGANNYTINPGNINSNVVVLSPTFNTMYTIIGSVGSCVKATTKTINVDPPFLVYYGVTDSVPCISFTVGLNAWGASSFTFNPGGLVGNIITVSPTVLTVYTLTAKNANQCSADTTFIIRPIDCNLVSIRNINTEREGFNVYPNPVKDKLTIESDFTNYNLEIINVLGDVVYQEEHLNTNKLSIRVDDWPKGVYMIKLTANSDMRLIRSIIVE